jgi:acyl-CoA reductase-like NAD-dependent aldehyde dehydrogenase
LKKFEENNRKIISERRKPKGSVLIILSYNEPLILSIIPVLSALTAGNKVKIKPSRKAQEIVKKIWLDSGIILKYQLDLEILFNLTPALIAGQIKVVNAVYFFGGYNVAKKIAKICAKNFVEFFPEIEAADCKVVNYKRIKNFDFKKDAALTLDESFSHCGQICHRVQGIILIGDIYKKYVGVLRRQFLSLGEKIAIHLADDYEVDKEYLQKTLGDIEKSYPEEVIKFKNFNRLPMLVISPKFNSNFVRGAYFLPILWVMKMNSEEEVLTFLNSKKYYLGVNIFSDDNKFINRVINKTRFSRYTINISHTKIGFHEGWGGVWPSGFSGYKSWIEHFTDSFTIIQK